MPALLLELVGHLCTPKVGEVSPLHRNHVCVAHLVLVEQRAEPAVGVGIDGERCPPPPLGRATRLPSWIAWQCGWPPWPRQAACAPP
eukprot:9156701-Pyramimonas_sp.AAC.1